MRPRRQETGPDVGVVRGQRERRETRYCEAPEQTPAFFDRAAVRTCFENALRRAEQEDGKRE